MVGGISLLPVLSQGLVDSRERSMAVQALTYMRDHGHALVPEQLAVEAIRNEWPGTSPLELADLAKQLNAGRRLRYGDSGSTRARSRSGHQFDRSAKRGRLIGRQRGQLEERQAEPCSGQADRMRGTRRSD